MTTMRKAILFLIFVALIASPHLVSAQTGTDYETNGDVAMAGSNFQQAVDSYTQAIKTRGHDKDILAQLYNKRATCYAQLKQFDKAIADFSKAITLNPQFENAYWARANVYENDGKYQLAINDYKEVIPLLKVNDGLAAVYSNIAQNELALQHYNEALDADSMSIKFGSQSSRAYEIRGKIHVAQHKPDSAINDYNQALISLRNSNTNDMKEVSFVYTIKGDAELDLKKYKDAINDYSFAIQFNGENGFAWWNRAAAYHSNGDYKLAADDYTKAMGYYQGDSTNLSKLYDDRASNELAQSVLPKAIEDDSLAIALDPGDKNAYYNRANAYTQNGDYQQGIDYFKKFITFFKNDKKLEAFIYYEIANNEYFLNEFDNVVADCTKAISLDPTYQETYYYRAKVYFKKMGKTKLAMNDFNKVIALDTTKKSVGYVFSLFYTGKGDEAAAILQNDLLSTNDSPQLLADYYNLACLYSLMNKPDEANIYLKKAFDNGYAKKYAIADEDLDNIRNTDDYKAAIAAAAN
jgi:tetratricopeptide (TPR) repeat protein